MPFSPPPPGSERDAPIDPLLNAPPSLGSIQFYQFHPHPKVKCPSAASVYGHTVFECDTSMCQGWFQEFLKRGQGLGDKGCN